MKVVKMQKLTRLKRCAVSSSVYGPNHKRYVVNLARVSIILF